MKQAFDIIAVLLVGIFGFSLGSGTLSSILFAFIGVAVTVLVISTMSSVEKQVDNVFNNSHFSISYSEDDK